MLILYLGWLPNLYAFVPQEKRYLHAIGGIESGTTGESGRPMLALTRASDEQKANMLRFCPWFSERAQLR